MAIFPNWDQAFYYCLATDIPFLPGVTVIASDDAVAVIRP